MLKYLAPMEGITDYIYRDTFLKHYGGVDFCITPFIAPNQNHVFPERDYKHIDPVRNDLSKTIPQLIGNDSTHMIWALGEIQKLGYNEININLGCPSGTVTAKKKGSGLLRYTDELNTLLEKLYDFSTKNDLEISIKTRIGFDSEDEWPTLLEIYNKYPVKALTVHPRITKDYYNGSPRMAAFDYAVNNSKNPLIYNGDLKTNADIKTLTDKYKNSANFAGFMIGRGLITSPWLLAEDKKDSIHFKAFYNELYRRYADDLPGDVPLLHRMKEFWSLWSLNYTSDATAGIMKNIMKAKKRSEYEALIREIL